jgi:hypothetical protein
MSRCTCVTIPECRVKRLVATGFWLGVTAATAISWGAWFVFR